MIELKRILAPTDFSEYSAEAIGYACELADKFDSELHLLHILEVHASSTPVFGGGLAFNPRVRESRAAAEKALESVASGRVAVRATAEGPTFLEILRYAKDNAIDLIVMGTHGRSGLAHVMLGSVAERVVRKAPCPVLTVRHPKHQFVMPFDQMPTRRLLDSPQTEGTDSG
jgi:nucleotide-binding universal stress UspA family protein